MLLEQAVRVDHLYMLAYGDGGVRRRPGKADRGDPDARGSEVGFVKGSLFDH